MNDVAPPTGIAPTAGSSPDDEQLRPARSATEWVRQKPTIVIVGGGFAGLAAARALRHANAEIILIDRRNHNIFQPLLYQVATAVLSPAEIATPIRQLEVKQRNLSVFLGEVTGVEVTARTIDVSPRTQPCARSRSIIWWLRPACTQATLGTTNSPVTRPGSRTLATPR